jgi:fumarylacetoacetase
LTWTSWVEVPADSGFPIQNLPFGIFSTADRSKRVGVAIGEMVLDLKVLHVLGYLENLPFTVSDLDAPALNQLIARGKPATRELRARLQKLLRSDWPDLRDREHHVRQALVSMDEVALHLPVNIGDYTDFYSSEDHARNVGKMFRDPENALLPNWKHLPVGYHGRASSIVVSGTPLHRPSGQTRPNPEEPPQFGPTRLLDFELETAFITYPGKPMGESISMDEAEDHIFGVVLFNDWSARDIQAWEYVPLGPFLAKNFGSTMSPWVVTLDALEPYRISGPVQDPEVLPYLKVSKPGHFDVNLKVELIPDHGEGRVVCESNLKYLYWNMSQQLAHHTVNGCNMRGGDVLASGTISGPDTGSFGSMLEITWRGSQPITMPDGSERKFIHDGDTVRLTGLASAEGLPNIGFGEASGRILS